MQPGPPVAGSIWTVLSSIWKAGYRSSFDKILHILLISKIIVVMTANIMITSDGICPCSEVVLCRIFGKDQ